MKFIIYIIDRLRQGRFPRLPDFSHSDKHGLYIYQGRELSADEFNEAAKIVFATNFRDKGFSFAPMVIVAQPAQKRFSLEGRAITLDGKRIAAISGKDNELHVFEASASLRPEIEAWLLSNTTTPRTP